MTNSLAAIIGFIAGAMVQTFLIACAMVSMKVGTLKVANDNGEKYLFADLDMKPDRIVEKRWVVMRVDPKEITPHK